MAAALVQICVDPRLNQELLRIQVRQKLERLQLAADRIYILNEIGGNVGANFRNTVDMLNGRSDSIIFCAVLHHDDCLAVQQGLRNQLGSSAQEMTSYLAYRNINCPVVTGNIRTENNQIIWSDEPQQAYQPFTLYTGR